MTSYINDRYRIIRKLSPGNMSTVYLCKDTESDELDMVAVKVFDKTVNDKVDELQNKIFYREVETLERVSHENIVGIIDKGFDERLGCYYIVLEFVDGTNLNEAFESIVDFSFDKKFNLLEQILIAVEYLHKKSIIHRDLKPSNIMIDDNNNIKIIDFGISKIKDTFYNEFTVMNFATPKYASPEQERNQTVTNQSDIYSLGIIFYELFSNAKLKNKSEIDLNLLPDNITEIIKNMIAPELSERYPNIGEIKKDIILVRDKTLQQNYIPIAITQKVILKLYKKNYIKEENRIFAGRELKRDFEGKVYITEYDNSPSKSYRLFGKLYTLICVFDRSNTNRLVAKDIHFHDAAYMNMKKEQSYPIPYKVEIITAGEAYTQKEVNANDLINQLDDFDVEYRRKKEDEIIVKDITQKWKEILKLQRSRVEKEKKSLRYKKFEYLEDTNSITVELEMNTDDIKFTSDDLLAMTDRFNLFNNVVVGYLRAINGKLLTIDLSANANVEKIALSGEICVDKTMAESSLSRQEKALKMVQYKEIINPKISDIIYNPSLARSKQNIILTEKDCFSKLIDNSKLRSLEGALAANDIYLLQGPPGTGKTKFISELVCQILKEAPHSKILIASQSNVAVDHSLTKINEIRSDVSMIRIGIQEKFSKSVASYTVDAFFKKWSSEVIARCNEAIEEYKKEIGIDDAISEKNKIILEIESLKSELIKLNNEIRNVENEKNKLYKIYNKWQVITRKISDMIGELRKNNKKISDESLLDIMEGFDNKISGLSTELETVIEETINVSDKKADIEKQYDYLIKQVNEKNSDIQEWKEIIGVSNDKDYQNKKDEIEKLVKENKIKYNEMCKIENICSEWKERIKSGNELFQECIEDVTIVGATCLGITNLSSKIDLEFDWVIVDEAGRATPPEILVPIGLGKKIVLVGDHKQLPPVVDEKLAKDQLDDINVTKEDLEESLFAYLEEKLDNSCKSILNQQYRMNPVIGQLISHIFYDDFLQSETTIEEKSIPFSFWGNKALVWLSTSNLQDAKEEVVYGTQITYVNNSEANIIFEYIVKMDKELREKNIKKEIAIITGYRAQKELLIRIYESQYVNKLHMVSIEINTIDAFQGRETDIVFYSVVRNNDEGNVGFLSDVRRLNVAFSRAKELLVVVGNHSAVIKKRSMFGKANPFVKIIEYIYENKEYCLLREVKYGYRGFS